MRQVRNPGRVRTGSEFPTRWVGYYQNALSALGTLQRAPRTESRKAARVFFAETAAVEFFPGCEHID
jgi:hypothetical protein